MTIQPSPYEIIRAIQDQQRATDRLVQMLAGMLDKSAPDPFLDELPALGEVRPIAPTRTSRRVLGDAARPPVIMIIEGVEVKTTARRAKLLHAVLDAPLTLSEMTRKGVSPTVDAVKQQIIDTNHDLERAGVDLRVRVVAKPAQRLGARGGREPAVYALLPPISSEIASPETFPAAQSEAAASARLDQAASECAIRGGDVIVPAQDAEFVTSTGAGEGVSPPADPAPAMDDLLPETGEQKDEAVKPRSCLESSSAKASLASDAGPAPAVEDERPAHAIPAKTRAVPRPPKIEPGSLVAVAGLQIVTASGSYTATGANMARSLDLLRGGLMFGLDVVAKRCGWQSPEVARTALLLERPRLAQHGLDLYLDKINVRLREAS